MRSHLHRVFRVAVIIKGIDGCLEIVSGLVLAWLGPERIFPLVSRMSGHWLSHSAEKFSEFYLTSHGVVKLLLAIGLLAERAWTSVAGFWVLVGLIAYQFDRYSQTRSALLFAFTLYDVGVAALLVREMQTRRRASIETAAATPFPPSRK